MAKVWFITGTSKGFGHIWAKAALLAREFLKNGRSDPLAEASMPYPELQALFPEH